MNDTTNGGDFEIRLLASQWRMLADHWELPVYRRIDLLHTVEDFHSDPLPRLDVYSETRLRLLLDIGRLLDLFYPSQIDLRIWLLTEHGSDPTPIDQLAGSLHDLRGFHRDLMLKARL